VDNINASSTAQRDVIVAGGVVNECIQPDGGVGIASGVRRKREITVGRVVLAGGIASEGINTGGRVLVAVLSPLS